MCSKDNFTAVKTMMLCSKVNVAMMLWSMGDILLVNSVVAYTDTFLTGNFVRGIL